MITPAGQGITLKDKRRFPCLSPWSGRSNRNAHGIAASTGLLHVPERQHAVPLHAGCHSETSNPKETPMSDLIVIVYPSEEKAEEVASACSNCKKNI
jgi:hypothetical protein